MDFNMWYIFASLLLVSVGARRYDQGPQTFYDVSSDFSTAEQNNNEEVIVYLTPDQLTALEADGAVVRTDDDTENEETDSGLPSEPQVAEDQEEESELEQNEPSQQEEEGLPEEVQQEEEEGVQEEQETPENIQEQDINFEEILRILNEEVEEGGDEIVGETARNEPQVEEENTESPRNFSPRIVLPQQQPQTLPKSQQQQRYLAPSVAKQEILKSYSLIRYQPNQQRQVINFQIQQQGEANEEETSEEPQTEASTQEKKKFKLIPYEVEEPQEVEQVAEEPAQDNSRTVQNQRLNNFIAALKATRFSGSYGQRKNRVQSMLRQYKVSPKYLQKQKTETVPKASSGPNKQQLNKKRLQDKTKQAARGADSQIKQKKPQISFASAANTRPIPVPVLKNQKTKAQKSIFVPVETEKRENSRNVKAKTNKPYIISRRATENKRQSPVEVRYLRGPRE